MSIALPCKAAEPQPIDNLLQRILVKPGDARRVSWTIDESLSTKGEDAFTTECDGRRLMVKGSSVAAVCTGIHWWLQHALGTSVSWTQQKVHLPRRLPQTPKETRRASVALRYYLNFCTHSYTMAFWDWQRWEQEIDWMALHGVNMPLVITGFECVWRDVLSDGSLNLPNDIADRFITGPAYFGWFFMNNMTGWGGPLPESWYSQRLELARRIFSRMSELGMKPVIPGFVGMWPNTGDGQQPKGIVDGGRWCSFERPAFVKDTLLLQTLGQRYYAAVDRLFGDVLRTHYYAIDPFHEGGIPRGVVNPEASIRAMWDALTTYDSQAIWVAQHWQSNPLTCLTHVVPRHRLLILDLHGESNPDVLCSGHHTLADGQPHDWVWCMLNNYGGNVGLFGRAAQTLATFQQALLRDRASANPSLVGIGTIPEGIENNPMLFEMLYALPWEQDTLTLEAWIHDWVKMRYGVDEQLQTKEYKALKEAWLLISNSVYTCPAAGQQGTTESVFLMRPSTHIGSVSSWANSSWYWRPEDVRKAAELMLSVASSLRRSEHFRYDLVDVVRQAVADEGKRVLEVALNAQLPVDERLAARDRFLSLLNLQDSLLGTRREFRLDTWLHAARASGTNTAESDLYERNARMLITTWADRQQCDNGGLHDYANREWQGLLKAYYLPRWQAFFEAWPTMAPEQIPSIDWFGAYEFPFATGHSVPLGSFDPPASELGKTPKRVDEIALARECLQTISH